MIPGDICSFPFVNRDGEVKPRPMVVVSVGPTGPGEDEVVVVAPITGSPAHVQHPRTGDVILDDYLECGLNRLSVVRGRQFAGVPLADLTPREGDRVSPGDPGAPSADHARPHAARSSHSVLWSQAGDPEQPG